MIVLIRHPRPLVEPGLCYGRLDLDLHPDGMAAIPAIVAALDDVGPAPVWSSPARRCRIPASAIAAARAATPILDERLRELDFGDWEGRPWNDVPRAPLDAWAADPAGFAPPGGETGTGLLRRVAAFHAQLRDTAGNAVIVSHGGPLKLLLALLEGRKPDLLATPPPLGAILRIDPH